MCPFFSFAGARRADELAHIGLLAQFEREMMLDGLPDYLAPWLPSAMILSEIRRRPFCWLQRPAASPTKTQAMKLRRAICSSPLPSLAARNIEARRRLNDAVDKSRPIGARFHNPSSSPSATANGVNENAAIIAQ
jgi:hypothetical protein